MDSDHDKWQKQYWSNFGFCENLRLGCAMLLWMVLSVGGCILLFSRWPTIASLLGTLVYFGGLIALMVGGLRWGPTYRVMRLLLGNRNWPEGPIPHTDRKPLADNRWKNSWPVWLIRFWWGIWGLVLIIVVLKYVF